MFSVGFVACGSSDDSSNNAVTTTTPYYTNGYNGGNVNCPSGVNCQYVTGTYGGQQYSIPYYQGSNGFYQPVYSSWYGRPLPCVGPHNGGWRGYGGYSAGWSFSFGIGIGY